MDHDFFWMFSRFWWVIFPLFWMVSRLAWLWSRHARANQALEVIKSYADQGKDIPPGVLAALKEQNNASYGRYWGRRGPRNCWRSTFFFIALACAFGGLALWQRLGDVQHPRNAFGFIIVAVVMTALAVASLLSNLLLPRTDMPPIDRSGKPQ